MRRPRAPRIRGPRTRPPAALPPTLNPSKNLPYSRSDLFKLLEGASAHGQDHRHRPRHHELVHGRARGRRADRHRERRGRSHDAVGRRVRASGERLVGTVAKRQAVTNPQNTVFSIKRFMGRKEAEVREEESIVPYKVVAGPNGDARVEAGGKQYSPPEISRDDPAEAEDRRRSVSRRGRRLGGHHRPRVLQRRPAPGHQGRRQDRRPRGQAHHQRADRRVARIRPRQGVRPDDPRVRPRRRHLRRVRARDRRRRVRGQVHRRRQPPRRRQLRQGDRRLAGGRVQEVPGHRPVAPTRWRCSASTRRPRRPRSSCPPRRRRRSTCRSSPPTPPAPSTSTRA